MKQSFCNPAGALHSLRYLIISGILLSLTQSAGAISGWDFAEVPIDLMCLLYNAFILIAAALGGLVIVISGVIWITAHDDPGKRKSAKTAIIHALIGLILVSIAAAIISGVSLKTSNNAVVTFLNVCQH